MSILAGPGGRSQNSNKGGGKNKCYFSPFWITKSNQKREMCRRGDTSLREFCWINKQKRSAWFSGRNKIYFDTLVVTFALRFFSQVNGRQHTLDWDYWFIFFIFRVNKTEDDETSFHHQLGQHNSSLLSSESPVTSIGHYDNQVSTKEKNRRHRSNKTAGEYLIFGFRSRGWTWYLTGERSLETLEDFWWKKWWPYGYESSRSTSTPWRHNVIERIKCVLPNKERWYSKKGLY